MRLPWGRLEEIQDLFLQNMQLQVIGCLSTEYRCTEVPMRLGLTDGVDVHLMVIQDPPDGSPDYSDETREKLSENESRLHDAELTFSKELTHLLATEDGLLELIAPYEAAEGSDVIVLDITSFPKRYFCFFLKRLLASERARNVVVTYTEAQEYTADHLAEDPMSSEHLPGFAAPPPPQTTLVLSLGFEALSLAQLLEIHGRETIDVHFFLPFPPDGVTTQRTWQTLRQVVRSQADRARGRVEVIATWDAEQVYSALARLHERGGGLLLAPFGPKPHTMAMALFAMKEDSGMYYTQPKSYNPSYSRGCGETWAYVAKWDGVACFDRVRSIP